MNQEDDITTMTGNLATKREYYLIMAVAIGIGLLVSLLKIYNDSVINDDAVLYLSLADTMVTGDWEHASAILFKPFYSALIAGVAYITGMNTIAAAHVINALLSSGLVFAFLYTFYHLGASARLLIITAVLVVFFPSLIKYKSMIIRDHGFIALMIFSTGNIFLYGKLKKIKYLVIAVVSVVLASLFRFEGLAFLAALPLIAYLAYTDSKLITYKSLALAGIMIAGGVLSLYLWQAGSDGSSVIDRLSSLVNSKTEYFMSKVDVISDNVLLKYNRDSAVIFAITGFFSILITSIIHRISIIIGGVAVYGYIKSPDFKNRYIKRSWLLFVVISFIVLLGLLFIHHIIIERYTLLLAILFLFPAAYGLHHLIYKNASIGKPVKNTVVVLVGLFLLVNTVQKLSASDKHRYIAEAADWMAENIPASATILSNNGVLLYHAGHSHLDKNGIGVIIGHESFWPWSGKNNPDYIAVTRDINTEYEPDIKSVLIKEITGNNKAVSIFKVSGK